jgi:YaiO family outer membrane protein
VSSDVEHVDREFAADTRLGARIDRTFSDRASLWLGATVTPKSSFRERWSIRGGAEVAARRNLTLLLDARSADYRISSVTVIEPGLRVTWEDGRWAAQVRSINLFQDERHRSGWSGRVERALPNDALLFAGAATYPDAEAGITRRVRGGYAGLLLPITDALILRLTADGEVRAATYDRFGLAVGLTGHPQR